MEDLLENYRQCDGTRAAASCKTCSFCIGGKWWRYWCTIFFTSGCATRLAKSKQPLSHSATLPERLDQATQPLSHSGRAADRSHSPTQPLWVTDWLSGLKPASLAEWLSGCEQPVSHWSHSEWLTGWVAAPATLPQPLSHSAILAERLTQPLSHSATLPVTEWLSGWRAIGV